MPRVRGLSTRPVKKKILQFAEDAPSGEIEDKENDDAENGDPLDGVLAKDGRDAAPELDSPRRRQLEEEEEAFMSAREHKKSMLKAQKAKKKHKLQLRLHNAKMARWGDKKRWPSQKKPFLAAARMYEAIVEMGNADLMLALAERDAARAEASVFACEIGLLELESAS